MGGGGGSYLLMDEERRFSVQNFEVLGKIWSETVFSTLAGAGN